MKSNSSSEDIIVFFKIEMTLRFAASLSRFFFTKLQVVSHVHRFCCYNLSMGYFLTLEVVLPHIQSFTDQFGLLVVFFPEI